MSKTISFTDEEIKVLGLYLWENPCSSGCCYEVPNNVDCYDMNTNGIYKCPFQQISSQLTSKIFDEEDELKRKEKKKKDHKIIKWLLGLNFIAIIVVIIEAMTKKKERVHG